MFNEQNDEIVFFSGVYSQFQKKTSFSNSENGPS